MFTELRCSFCRKTENEVAKLVAGPHVYICDRCVKIAVDIMENDAPPPATRPSVFKRIVDRLLGVRRGAIGAMRFS